jgi:hypothetical protein
MKLYKVIFISRQAAEFILFAHLFDFLGFRIATGVYMRLLGVIAPCSL